MLQVTQDGAGEVIVLLHGWGFSAAVWDELAARLAPQFRVLRPDLPGHGRSAPVGQGYSLDALVDALMDEIGERVTGPALWVGWSLGALPAMQAALRYPERVRGVVSIAGTPCFAARPGWSHAVEPALLRRFADDLAGDW